MLLLFAEIETFLYRQSFVTCTDNGWVKIEGLMHNSRFKNNFLSLFWQINQLLMDNLASVAKYLINFYSLSSVRHKDKTVSVINEKLHVNRTLYLKAYDIQWISYERPANVRSDWIFLNCSHTTKKEMLINGIFTKTIHTRVLKTINIDCIPISRILQKKWGMNSQIFICFIWLPTLFMVRYNISII